MSLSESYFSMFTSVTFPLTLAVLARLGHLCPRTLPDGNKVDQRVTRSDKKVSHWDGAPGAVAFMI